MKKQLLCLLSIVCQFVQAPRCAWAVVPPPPSLEETQISSQQSKDERLEKTIDALEKQEDRLRTVVDQLESERQQMNKSKESIPADGPVSSDKKKEELHGHHLH